MFEWESDGIEFTIANAHSPYKFCNVCYLFWMQFWGYDYHWSPWARHWSNSIVVDDSVKLFLHIDLFKDIVVWQCVTYKLWYACVNSKLKVMYRKFDTVGIKEIPIFWDNKPDLLVCDWVDWGA